MGKIFNVTGDCKPKLHYMVDLSEKLAKIKAMVDDGQYFTINRARQYGKTTTLGALERFLGDAYYVVSLDFQYQMSNAKFRDENTFSVAFAKAFISTVEKADYPLSDKMSEEIGALKTELADNRADLDLVELFQHLSAVCEAADKPIVLMIDEVDSATNNQVFLDFLAQLRGYYLKRDRLPTFQSVILAGVYDVKNIKRNLRPDEEHKTNSPWNARVSNEENESLLAFDDCTRDQRATPFDIAADFDVVMSFSAKEIEGMLREYEADNHTGMDVAELAALIYDYTSGYPYLVSRICKLMDEKLPELTGVSEKAAVWNTQGVLEAVNLLLTEKNTLFESLFGKLNDYPELRQALYSLLFSGKAAAYNMFDEATEIAMMFGFVKRQGSNIAVANRIFEILLYNHFLTSADAQGTPIFQAASNAKPQFIRNGHLDMDLIMRKFVEHFDSIYGGQAAEFDEEEGRRRFLLYLRPIINGVGNYYIEAQTRDARRMDVVIDYLGERFVIELKIWRGSSYNERGERQLSDYLDYFKLKKGYMFSYNFNQKKERGVKEIHLGDCVLVEAVV